MRYNTDKVLKVGHFSVYNAGIVQPGEKRRSRFIAPLPSVVAMQLFAYYVAIARDCEVDQPRNLAKSVTVE